ncbi:transporter substrate-binding domain-containing protein [Neptuniibacter caesariensis]|uniref:Solute-binding protein family 3/N-terminal domain-containing protein n=1 Tax=Neptuniibacter caesariensis TaxID=207954 RepID=A0A7U8C8D2_NEPCE|nr:transporter substrate-binding domain-containing protein [Neptuniibacter caesariensis]EAR62079.1 hypothetical protein MED92_10249 [Oceanospirillum sp. MED92] [Neptuniibacter caesariensis]
MLRASVWPVPALYSLVLCLLLTVSPARAADKDTLRFVVPEFPPYTYLQDGNIAGIGVRKIRSYLDELGTPYELSLVPNYGRAVQEVKHGRADGFFLATENEERNSFAVFSTPIVINNWSWFFPAESTVNPSDTDFKKTARIATHLKTNTHKWLLKNGYKVVYSPSDVDSLVKTLHHKRLTAVFLAEAVFWESCERQGIPTDRFRQVVESGRPMGIYISKQFLNNHDGFMDRLNHVIENQTAIASPEASQN